MLLVNQDWQLAADWLLDYPEFYGKELNLEYAPKLEFKVVKKR